MRMAGLEPARCCHRKILSLVRLPIPPHPLNPITKSDLTTKIIISSFAEGVKKFLEKGEKTMYAITMAMEGKGI